MDDSFDANTMVFHRNWNDLVRSIRLRMQSDNQLLSLRTLVRHRRMMARLRPDGPAASSTSIDHSISQRNIHSPILFRPNEHSTDTAALRNEGSLLEQQLALHRSPHQFRLLPPGMFNALDCAICGCLLMPGKQPLSSSSYSSSSLAQPPAMSIDYSRDSSSPYSPSEATTVSVGRSHSASRLLRLFPFNGCNFSGLACSGYARVSAVLRLVTSALSTANKRSILAKACNCCLCGLRVCLQCCAPKASRKHKQIGFGPSHSPNHTADLSISTLLAADVDKLTDPFLMPPYPCCLECHGQLLSAHHQLLRPSNQEWQPNYHNIIKRSQSIPPSDEAASQMTTYEDRPLTTHTIISSNNRWLTDGQIQLQQAFAQHLAIKRQLASLAMHTASQQSRSIASSSDSSQRRTHLISAFWQNKQTIESLLAELKERVVLSYFHVSCAAFMREQCYIFGLLSSDAKQKDGVNMTESNGKAFTDEHDIPSGHSMSSRTAVASEHSSQNGHEEASSTVPWRHPHFIPSNDILAEQHHQLSRQLRTAIIDADWSLARRLKQFMLDIEDAMNQGQATSRIKA